MNSPISMDGTIGTVPERRQTANGASLCRFRVACSDRRFDRETNAWVDGEASWMTVIAYRGLADHAHASLNKGDRVLVSGRLKVRPWRTDDGKSGVAVEIDADALGHDLRWGTSAFSRSPGASLGPGDAQGAEHGDTAADPDLANAFQPEADAEGNDGHTHEGVGELVGARAGSAEPPY